MDTQLKALCIEILREKIDSDQFLTLLMESGIEPEGLEWDVAARMMGKSDSMSDLAKRLKDVIH